MRSAPIPVTRTLGQEQEEIMRTQLGGERLDICVTASLMTSDLSELLVDYVNHTFMLIFLSRGLGDSECDSHLRSDFHNRGFLLLASDLPRQEAGCQTSEES